MAYNEKIADRIRDYFQNLKKVEEKPMMGGLTFMINDKMCVGVFKDEMMCRIDPSIQDEVLSRNGCRQMEMGGKKMNGYILVDDHGMKSMKDFKYWIELCLAYNKISKSSKKKK